MSVAPRRIGGGEIAPQRDERPAVTGDVMKRQQQHVRVWPEPEQVRPQRRLVRQIEATRGRSSESLAKVLFGDLHDLEPGAGGRGIEDELPWHPESVGEDGAQA